MTVSHMIMKLSIRDLCIKKGFCVAGQSGYCLT